MNAQTLQTIILFMGLVLVLIATTWNTIDHVSRDRESAAHDRERDRLKHAVDDADERVTAAFTAARAAHYSSEAMEATHAAMANYRTASDAYIASSTPRK